ncbi:MAG: glycosyltransferase, partial [Planctomycetes bacterium]|nr:glycosyltransferase [Planctomycetota bacterium]
MNSNFGRTLNSNDHRRVLMIAAAFPPTGGPGVQRSAKFAKYLPRFGWQPIVWTVDRLADLPQDDSLLTDLPSDIQVLRLPDRGLGQTARRSLRRTARRGGLLSKVAQAAEWRLAARADRNSYPDDCAGWARNSLGPICQLVRDEGIDVIYSTFSPASDHVLAMAVKQETGLPWVADFRDLWTDDYRYPVDDANRRAADRQLEQEILEQADAVIGVSARQTEILASRVPDPGRKFVTITNGFDPDDFSGANPVTVFHSSATASAVSHRESARAEARGSAGSRESARAEARGSAPNKGE